MNNQEQKISEPSKQNNFEENTIALTDVIIILARQLKVIILTPLIFCTLVIIYVFFIAKPVYTSTSKIMSSSGGANGSQAAGIAAQFGISMPTGQSEPKWAYPEIIKSRTLAGKMLKRKFDSKEFGPQQSLLKILSGMGKKSPNGLNVLEINTINIFLGMIEITENKKTSILTLSINAAEPKLAAEINHTLIDELDAHQRAYNKSKTSETKNFIQERIIDAEKDLNTAEEALRDFINRNRRIDNSPLLQLERQRLAREVTVLTGVFTTLKQQFETTKIEEVKESEYVVIIDPPAIPLKPSRPQKVRMVLLSGIFGLGLG